MLTIDIYRIYLEQIKIYSARLKLMLFDINSISQGHFMLVGYARVFLSDVQLLEKFPTTFVTLQFTLALCLRLEILNGDSMRPREIIHRIFVPALPLSRPYYSA